MVDIIITSKTPDGEIILKELFNENISLSWGANMIRSFYRVGRPVVLSEGGPYSFSVRIKKMNSKTHFLILSGVINNIDKTLKEKGIIKDQDYSIEIKEAN